MSRLLARLALGAAASAQLLSGALVVDDRMLQHLQAQAALAARRRPVPAPQDRAGAAVRPRPATG
jgi:hypothetical protein